MIDDGTCYDLTVQYFGQSVADSTSIIRSKLTPALFRPGGPPQAVPPAL